MHMGSNTDLWRDGANVGENDDNEVPTENY